MAPELPEGGMLLAPGSASVGGAALRLPGPRDVPSLDEQLVEPETGQEMIRGRRVVAMPAKPPHADRQFGLVYVIGAHVKAGFVGAAELLTHAAEGSDFATDVCIRREGIDPETETRYLEELVFEVVNEQSLSDIAAKAEDLTARGVRRVVAIFVKTKEVCEWSVKNGTWRKLDLDEPFSDPTLLRPLRVRALLEAAEADNAVVRAMVAKKNPEIVKIQEECRAEGRKEGEAAGLRVAVRDLCEALQITLTPKQDAALEKMDSAELDALRVRLKRDRCWG